MQRGRLETAVEHALAELDEFRISCNKGPAKQAAEKLIGTVILRRSPRRPTKNLCIRLKIQMQGSFAELRMTVWERFSASYKVLTHTSQLDK
jgi:hypothetical protein